MQPRRTAIGWWCPGAIFSRRDRKANGAEVSDLFPNELLQSDAVQFLILEAEVERAVAHGLVLFAVELRHEGMLQCIVDRDALPRVDLEHSPEKVYALGRCIGELLTQGHRCLVRQFAHEAFCLFGCDEVKFVLGQLPKLGCDES